MYVHCNVIPSLLFVYMLPSLQRQLTASPLPGSSCGTLHITTARLIMWYLAYHHCQVHRVVPCISASKFKIMCMHLGDLLKGLIVY